MSLLERLAGIFDNPLIIKDGVSRMRSWRAPVVITAYLGLLGAFGFATFVVTVLTAQGSRAVSATVGAYVFGALAYFQLALICLFTPALAAGAISGERERQTFDVLLVSRVTAAGIVWGKLVASLAYVLLLILTALPLYAAVFLFGGIDFEQFLLTQLLTVVAALVIGAQALFFSALFRRTLPSTVMSYAGAFALTVGTALVGLLLTYLEAARRGSFNTSEAHLLLFANPIYSMGVVLSSSPQSMRLGRILQVLVISDARPSSAGPDIDPWVATVLVCVAWSALCLLASWFLVRGRRNLQPRRRPRPEPLEAAL